MRWSRAVRVGSVFAVLCALVPAAEVAAQDDVVAARARAKALVARMTLDEKISQVHGGEGFPFVGFAGFTPAIERLGIPAFHLADGPNGVGGGATGVTAFPGGAIGGVDVGHGARAALRRRDGA